MNDLPNQKNEQEQKKVKRLMMTSGWLKLYETKHVMLGRWGYGKEFCQDTVKDFASGLQSLKAKKIIFGPYDSNSKRKYLGTIDCVHCETNEFRTDPSSKWYSHKHNGAGVLYKVVIDLCNTRVVWIAACRSLFCQHP